MTEGQDADYRQLDTLGYLDALRYAYGRPTTSARFKVELADFQVDEELGFEPSGKGEHLYLQIRKQDLTTPQTARRLSEFSGVPLRDIGYAGMKDQKGLTRQWFSLRLPGTGQDPALSGFENSQLEIQQRRRNHRKLQVGSHRRNHFRLLLRHCEGERDEFERRLTRLAEQGMPNYFGAQRFGRDLGNLDKVRRYFQEPGRRLDRQQRGMLLSAARAYLFNQVLSQRVSDELWCRYVDGDVLNLDGTQRLFAVAEGEWDAALQARLAGFDIHITGPLPGRVNPEARYTSRRQAADMENAILARHDEFVQGLTLAGVEAGRRPLRSRVDALRWEWQDAASLALSFTLPRGAYATSMLRELCLMRQGTPSEPEDRTES